MVMEAYKLFSDGGARGNPGPGGIGVILFDKDDKLVNFENKFITNTTNNRAEYEALIMGLKLAQKSQVKNLKCHLDSELAVKQLNGEYKVKDEFIKELHARVLKEAEMFENIEFIHVRRELNKFADRLVNLAMDIKLQ